jgi:hypothetical protein
MESKDKIFKEKILPMYHQLQNEIKIVLSPKFQAHYREITPEIITLLVNFQEETFSLWLHQEK